MHVLAHPQCPFPLYRLRRAPLASIRAGFGGMRAMSSAAKASTDNFKVDVNADGIAVVTMDFKGMKVNALARNVVEELPGLVDSLEADASVRAIVFVSAKKDFIVGADINMFKELAAAGRDGVKAMVTSSHPVFDKLASGKPKIAAINGSCLGGGAEFALACHYRIAATQASMGFPEVMLGLLPGFGGTQRLPALVGMQNAMPMLMTGSNKKGAQAKKMSLVDQTCDQKQLMQCAMVVAKQIADGDLKIPKRGNFKGMYGMVENAIKEYGFVRDYVFDQAKQQV